MRRRQDEPAVGREKARLRVVQDAVERALAVPGWMSAGELTWLADQASRCQVVIEIGCWQGRSTRALAGAMRHGSRVYAVDVWQGLYRNDDGTVATWMHMEHGTLADAYLRFRRHLADHLLSGRVVAVRSPSFAALRTLASQGITADLVFIDGDHRYAAVRSDMEEGRALVRPGGLLAGHDFGHADWPGVARAVREVLGGEPDGVHETIWWHRVG